MGQQQLLFLVFGIDAERWLAEQSAEAELHTTADSADG